MIAGQDERIRHEIDALGCLDRSALLVRWQSAFGRTAPPHLSRSLMVKAIAHELQVKVYGSLSARTRRFLKAAMKTPVQHAQLKVGTRLVREWNGGLYEVDVVDDGYRWHGQSYRSLSAIAQAITGTKWSGPRFFGVGGS